MRRKDLGHLDAKSRDKELQDPALFLERWSGFC